MKCSKNAQISAGESGERDFRHDLGWQKAKGWKYFRDFRPFRQKNRVRKAESGESHGKRSSPALNTQTKIQIQFPQHKWV